MSRIMQVMIVENNLLTAESIRQFFTMKGQVQISNVVSNSLEAIELLKSGIPDAIILDLVLPKADGFVLLEHLKSLKNECKPVIIVTSSLSHQSVIHRACELGANYYIVKPFSVEVLHERVLNFLDIEFEELVSTPMNNNADQAEPDISSLLLKIGIPPQNKGFKYISEASKMVLNEPELINNLTKQLYPGIGKKFSTGPNNVERGIRHAIEVAWNSKKLQNINEILNCSLLAPNYKPTNGELISLIYQVLTQNG